MKNLIPILLLSILSMAMGAIDEATAELELQNIVADQEQNFTNLEGLTTDLEKKNAFSTILSDVLGNLAIQQWNPPSGAWPIVDWGKVDKLDNFFQDQFNWIIQDEVIADTAKTLAKLQFSGSVVFQQTSLASGWFESWLLEKVLAPDDNIKRVIFWYGEDFGSDLEGEIRVINWNLWEQTFNAANDLGKAIILKNLTVLASRVDGWENVADIHMLVFNGNNDALKAIALVKGHKNLGDGVIDKWKDIAQNSTNAKLKNLAQEVLERQQIEIEQPE